MNSADKPQPPSVAEVMERRKQHQMVAHGGEVANPNYKCSECMRLEAILYAAAKAANAWPLDKEHPR
ncbi:MAG: hypothetical protein WBL63_16450 [Candidatus Acidiferrum sp.]